MDYDFIKNAEKITTFNFHHSTFCSLDKKEEIQYLFKKHYFSGEEIKTTQVVCKDSINHIVTTLKEVDKNSFKALHNYTLNGIGPSEVALYFYVDTAVLGGPSSNGQDIIDSEEGYESKACAISNNREAYSFELGRTVYLSDLSNRLNDLAQELGVYKLNGDIGKINMDLIRVNFPKEFNEIEGIFKERAYEYFKPHKTIFINNSKYSPIGKIEEIKYVQYDDISIDRITRCTIQPRIKL